LLRGSNANITGDRDSLIPPQGNKKTDVADHPQVINHVGLLVNEPPGTAGLPSI